MRALSKITKNYEVLLDQLILVSDKDQFIRSVDKWEAHSNRYIAHNDSLPHRAFSIFLFNQQNQLLLQKRSSHKKTFPLCWTNTCCSHPNMIKLLENGQIQEQCIRAALHRALVRQLCLDIPHQEFYFMEKILYKQQGSRGEEDFGEFELDYIYLGKLSDEVKFKPAAQQIAEVQWMKRQNLQGFVNQTINSGGQLSPWFLKMYKSEMLQKWWKMVQENQLIDFPEENQSIVTNLL